MIVTELLYTADQSSIYITLADGENISIDVAWEESLVAVKATRGTAVQQREKLEGIDRALEILNAHHLRCDRLKMLGAELLLQLTSETNQKSSNTQNFNS